MDIDGNARTSPPTDALLIGAADGDVGDFAALYDELVRRVYGVVRSVVRDPTMSEDVAHEVMIEVWRTADRWEPGRGSSATWILVIAHHRAVDFVRREEGRRAREATFDRIGAPVRPAGDGADPADVATQDDAARAVSVALADLRHDQRVAIELAYFGGLTHRQIADRLGCPLGTIKTRIRSGLQALHRSLERDIVRVG